MNVLRSGIVTMLLLAAFSVQAACTWPAWEQFKKDYISQEGRVIVKIWCNSRYIGWNLLIRITRTSLPPVSVLCYVRAILMARKNSSIGCRS